MDVRDFGNGCVSTCHARSESAMTCDGAVIRPRRQKQLVQDPCERVAGRSVGDSAGTQQWSRPVNGNGRRESAAAMRYGYR